MDDDEYYQKMRNHNLNRSSGWMPKKSKSSTSQWTKWSITQGREDADMLEEKQLHSSDDSNNSIEESDD